MIDRDNENFTIINEKNINDKIYQNISIEKLYLLYSENTQQEWEIPRITEKFFIQSQLMKCLSKFLYSRMKKKTKSKFHNNQRN